MCDVHVPGALRRLSLKAHVVSCIWRRNLPYGAGDSAFTSLGHDAERPMEAFRKAVHGPPARKERLTAFSAAISNQLSALSNLC
jgi:hypothetical protein